MGGNISRDPLTTTTTNHHSKKLRSGFRNNSATPTVLTTSQENHNTTTAVAEEKGSIIQHPSKRIIHGRTYHANPDSTYMLPRDDIEIDRLHEEHFVIKELLGL